MHGRGPEVEHPDPFGDALPTLVGARVRLRPVREADVPDVLAMLGDGSHLRFWSHGPLADLDAARTYVEGMNRGFAERSLFQWVAADPETDRLVGTVTFVGWDRQNRRCELGFILHPYHTGKGLASDAVRTALAFAVDTMGLHRVEADVDPENTASARLLERLGFRLEGRFRERWFTWFEEWKDSAMYGLLADDLVRGAEGG
ncbi:GNAT family N-acetyltransferase [Rubrivirga sp. IMCC45206]|uniref:GNAT family N-acetyltransferase n=1 Tax=Rubrivirga sp. IMCC45206 TaxID=3391614 RepID=UPI0039903A58